MKSLLTSVAVLAIAATMLTTPAISQTGGSGQANPPPPVLQALVLDQALAQAMARAAMAGDAA